MKSVSTGSAVPGSVLTYTVANTSTGSVDARTVVLVDAIPAPTVHVTSSATGPGTVIELSHDGGASFNSSDAPPVTHLRWRLAAPLPPGGSGTLSLQARAP